MITSTDPDDAAATARRQLEADTERRVAAVRAVAEAARAVDDPDAALRAANTTHATTWAAAVGTGWSEKDLRQMGLRAPSPGATGTGTGGRRKTRTAQEPTAD